MRFASFHSLQRFTAAFAAVILALSAGGARLSAQTTLPDARLAYVFPAGGRQGTTLELTIGGLDLDDATRLQFSDPGISATPVMRPAELGETDQQPVPGKFLVTIKPDVKPGVFEARAIGKYGISNPRAFVVGTNKELTEKEPNDKPEQAMPVALGTVVNGRSEPATDQDYYKFAAKRGERIIIDCWAYRIDSRMDATLAIYDSAGQELGRDRDSNRRDALLDFVAPADGEYVVKVYDFLFRGSAEHFYRLSIGAQPYVDFVFPPAALPGTQADFKVYGRNLPGGRPSLNMAIDGKPLQVLSAHIAIPDRDTAQRTTGGREVEPIESALETVEYRLQTPQGSSNPVAIGLATAPVTAEQEPNDDPAKAPSISVPCELVGQFYPAADQDSLSFQAKAGQVYWIEVFSQRLGLTTDPFMLVQQVTKNDKGESQVKELFGLDDVGVSIGGLNYDTRTDDPGFRFVAPADGEYRVLLRDLNGSSRTNARAVYRLSIREPKPQFRLVAVPRVALGNLDSGPAQSIAWSPLLRKGGAEVIDVLVFRQDGFDEEIELKVEGLPAGVSCTGGHIPRGQNATLVLTAAENAAEAVASIKVVGSAKLGDVEMVRQARSATMIWPGLPGAVAPRWRLTDSLPLAVSGEPAAFSVEAGAAGALEMCRAGSIKVPFKVVRRGDFKGAIAVSAVFLQPSLQVKGATVEPNAAEGTLEITIANNAPLSKLPFYLLGTSAVNYARNPEAAQRAVARKLAIDKLVGARQEVAKAAAAEKAAVDRQLPETVAAARKAVEAQTAAANMVTALATALSAAQAQAKVAREAAAKEPANPALVAARDAADKAEADASAKAKAAAEAKAAADTLVANTAGQAKTAAEAKLEVDKRAAETDAAVKQAAAFQQSFVAVVTDLTNKAKPQNIQVAAPSANLLLTVTASPIQMTVTGPTVALKQGAKTTLPVSVARLYSFAGPVPLKVTVPQGAAGLTVKPAVIAADQNQATLQIEAGPNATPGTHKLVVQASPKLANAELPASQEISLTVEKIEPPKP